jgi:hypothetical protein
MEFGNGAIRRNDERGAVNRPAPTPDAPCESN